MSTAADMTAPRQTPAKGERRAQANRPSVGITTRAGSAI